MAAYDDYNIKGIYITMKVYAFFSYHPITIFFAIMKNTSNTKGSEDQFVCLMDRGSLY